MTAVPGRAAVFPAAARPAPAPFIAVEPAAAPEDLTWRDDALCAQTDPELFFPEKGGSTRLPKRVCRSCTVRAECLDYALDQGIREGIWGGLSERERRPLKHHRKVA